MDISVKFVYILCMKGSFFYTPSIHVHYAAFSHLEQWDIPNQRMPFWRLYWSDTKSAFVTLKKKKYYLKPEQFYLLPSHVDYSSNSDKPFCLFYVHFSLSWDYVEGIYGFPLDEVSKSLIDNSIGYFRKGDSAYQKQAAMLCYKLIFQGLTQLPFGEFKTQQSNKLQKVVNYIQDHLEDKLNNEDLAKMCNMNTSAFVRKFTQQYKVSPHRFINMVRCNRVSYYLADDDLSIDDIAVKVGFCDRYHLSRVYKSIRHISPGAHRKQILKEDFEK